MSLKIQGSTSNQNIILKRSIKGCIADILRTCFKLLIKEKSTSYLIKKFSNQENLETNETISLLTRSIHRHLYVIENKKILNSSKSTIAIFQSFADLLNHKLKSEIKEETEFENNRLTKGVSESQLHLKNLQTRLEKAQNENTQISSDYEEKLKDSFFKIESLAKEITSLKEENQNAKKHLESLRTEKSGLTKPLLEDSCLKEENLKLKGLLLEKQNEVSSVAQKANEQLTKLSQALVEKSKELEEAQTALITQINKLYKLTEDLKSILRSKENEISKLGVDLSNILSYLHKYHPDIAQKIEEMYDIL